jgi:hypothetical protein
MTMRTTTTPLRCSHGYLPDRCPYYLDPGVYEQPCPHFSEEARRVRSASGKPKDRRVEKWQRIAK